MLVRLTSVTTVDLRDVLEQAWRLNAPRRLVKEYEQTRKSLTLLPIPVAAIGWLVRWLF